MHRRSEALHLVSEDVGDVSTFDEFVEEEHDRLFKALYFVTGRREDAEDLAQDAFLKLWERWDRIDTIEDPTAYLFRVALNGFRMWRRHAAVEIRRRLPNGPERDEFSEVDIRADVRRVLLGLSTRQRAALVLVDLLGYPSKEAARILGVRASTVRNLVSQGRRHVRSTEGLKDV
jgi:RNA polymerase sigma-70 factor (ECF subfamily)